MTPYKELTKEELLEIKSDLDAQFHAVKAKGLKLDMSRGKPSTEQLNLSMEMMDVLKSDSDLVCEEGVNVMPSVYYNIRLLLFYHILKFRQWILANS